MADGSTLPKGKTDYSEVRKAISYRLNCMKEERLLYEPQWDELSKMFLPRRRPVSQKTMQVRGQRFNKHLYDSTGVKAKNITRAGLMDGISSPVRAWFNLGFRTGNLEDSAPVKNWLADVRKRMLRVMAKSNFYNAFASMYEEVAVYGTCAMLILEDFEDVIRCYPLEMGTYWLASDSRNSIDTLYREFEFDVGQIVNEFGLENCTPEIQEAYRNGKIDKKHWIIHAIEPNRPRALGYDDNQNMPYRSVYYMAGSPEDTVLRYSGFRSKPFVAWRWDLDTGDTYGVSPAMDALPFAKQLQFEQKQKGQGIAKKVNPPMVANPTMKNQPMSVVPGGVTFDGLAGTQAAGFRPAYQTNIELGDLREDIADIRAQVTSALFADLFLMISQLDDVRSATEIVERKQEKLMQLGPALQRAQDELLDPTVDRIFDLLFAIPGFFPPAPPEIHGQEIDVEYISTLFAAQKAAETGNIERLLAVVGNMASIFPTVLDKINSDELIDEYGEALSVPTKIINTTEQANVIRSDKEHQAQQDQAAQNAFNLARGAKVLSDTQVGGGRNALQAVTGL